MSIFKEGKRKGNKRGIKYKKKGSTIQTLFDKYCPFCVERYSCSDMCDYYKKEYIKEIYKKIEKRKTSSYSQRELSKTRSCCRNNNLDPNSSVGKGYITEVLVAKFLGINTCFDITDNFNHEAFDMYANKDWGIINVKGSILIDYNGYLEWCFWIHKNVIPDFFFCIGYDEDMKNVECVYIIPNEEHVSRLTRIVVYKDRHSKWNIFKESEEEVKKWNELFHTLKLENCPILRDREKNERLQFLLEKMIEYDRNND